MEELRANESRQGPLKIIKLPSVTQPFPLSEVTPKTLADLGFFQKTNNLSGREKKSDRLLESLEFHDVNEEYEEDQRVNQVTELKVIASSKNISHHMSIESSSVPLTNRSIVQGNGDQSKR